MIKIYLVYIHKYSVLGLLLLENKLIGYADDSTLMAVVPFPCIKFYV